MPLSLCTTNVACNDTSAKRYKSNSYLIINEEMVLIKQWAMPIYLWWAMPTLRLSLKSMLGLYSKSPFDKGDLGG